VRGQVVVADRQEEAGDLVSPERHIADEPPPFLGNWPRVYAMVLAYWALLIVGLYILTRALTP
jgi:hypothetical protein